MKKEIYISKGVGETRIAVKENGKLAELMLINNHKLKLSGISIKELLKMLFQACKLHL